MFTLTECESDSRVLLTLIPPVQVVKYIFDRRGCCVDDSRGICLRKCRLKTLNYGYYSNILLYRSSISHPRRCHFLHVAKQSKINSNYHRLQICYIII